MCLLYQLVKHGFFLLYHVLFGIWHVSNLGHLFITVLREGLILCCYCYFCYIDPRFLVYLFFWPTKVYSFFYIFVFSSRVKWVTPWNVKICAMRMLLFDTNVQDVIAISELIVNSLNTSKHDKKQLCGEKCILIASFSCIHFISSEHRIVRVF